MALAFCGMLVRHLAGGLGVPPRCWVCPTWACFPALLLLATDDFRPCGQPVFVWPRVVRNIIFTIGFWFLHTITGCNWLFLCFDSISLVE